MEGVFVTEVARRLPLAEAVLVVLRYVCEGKFLDAVFKCHRSRAYERALSFESMVHLLADALLQHGGRAHPVLERAAEAKQLETSMQAFYGKLRRMPTCLSQGFLREATLRMADLTGPSDRPSRVPRSLRAFEVVMVDGKKLKYLAKRLLAARAYKGSVLGGKFLAAWWLNREQVLAIEATLDGEANDGPLVPGLVQQVRGCLSGELLLVADSQFCDLTQPARFAAAGACFLVRYHPKSRFTRDVSVPQRSGSDAQGRAYTEEWGWLGRGPRRLFVRRIAVQRPDDAELVVVTDLLDADQYPACELLQLYFLRWDIETVFQRLSQVLHLRRLIGSTAEATIFQAALCCVLYNVLELLRSYVGTDQGIGRQEISLPKLCTDVEEELIAWHRLIDRPCTPRLVPPRTGPKTAKRLTKLLGSRWLPRWRKAASPKHGPRPKKQSLPGGHTSIYRLIQKSRQPVGCRT